MKWQLLEPHHIDEQVLPAGTIIGDDTQWPYRSTYDDPKIKRRKGDYLPPSRAMTPLDDEAYKAFSEAFGGEVPVTDPAKSIPLTGAQGDPRIPGVAAPRAPVYKTEPVNKAPDNEGPETGMKAKPPLSPSTPEPPLKPELQKPAGHDSAKNPGDSKDTETAKAPDIKKI